jgi:hypothetical protein
MVVSSDPMKTAASRRTSQRAERAIDGASARERSNQTPPYPGPMNPRVRRLIVSGVLGSLILIVVVTAAWNWLR